MISNQILQNTIEGIKSISRVDLYVADTDGKIVASTSQVGEQFGHAIMSFVASPADSQSVQEYQFFKVYDENQLELILIAQGTSDDVFMVGKMAAFQIQNLLVAYKERFDNISKDFENQLSLLEHLTNTYDNGIDNLEARGYLASTKFYEAMKNVEKQNIAVQKKELASLTKAMSEAVNSGEIKEGSEAWYDMQNDINAVKESIQESETAVIEFNNSIREIKWERFEYLQEQISNITDEANFMIDFLVVL